MRGPSVSAAWDRSEVRRAGPVAWRSPRVRLLQSVNGGETLVLKVHPDLRLADVKLGAFLLRDTATEKADDGRTDWQRLTFVGGGLAAPGGRPRPTLQLHAVEFRARQLAWWRVDHAALDAPDHLRRELRPAVPAGGAPARRLGGR